MHVLHLTDTHLFADPGASLRGTNTAQSLRQVIDHYTLSGWSSSLALVTGDLVQDDSADAYAHCRDHFKDLDQPIHLCAGNHDVPALMASTFDRPPFEVGGHVDVGEWRVVLLSSFVDGSAGGYLGDSEIARLKSACEVDRHVLIALHHPPVDLGSRWLDSVRLADSERLIDLATGAANVRCMLFGHAHQAYDADLDGVRILGTPSTCRQFLPESDDFAVDDRPPAYRRLELKNGGAVETEVVWVDSD